MTGDKNRIASFGIDYSKIFNPGIEKESISRRKYPFLKFTFPACKQCNESYGSNLEVATQSILTNIMNTQEINANDILILLDWFDKVRIGLWLGYLYYNKQLENIDPKFFINDRIATKDRALFIYKCQEKVKGINIVGPSGMLFSMIPSCFLIRINDYFFLNISKEFLLLEDLGFPFPQKIGINEKHNFYDDLAAGNKKINQNILGAFKIKNTSKAIFQPIFKQCVDICSLDNSYVRDNTIDQSSGVGCIYIKDKNIHKMRTDEKYILTPTETYTDAVSLLSSLGIKASKILINFALDEYKKIEQSSMDEDIKREMHIQLHQAITVEKLRMKRSKTEAIKVFNAFQ